MNNDEKQKKIDNIDSFEELEAFLSKKLKNRANAEKPNSKLNSNFSSNINSTLNSNTNSNLKPNSVVPRPNANQANSLNRSGSNMDISVPQSRLRTDNDMSRTRISDTVRPLNLNPTKRDAGGAAHINQPNVRQKNENAQNKNIVIDAKIREGLQQERAEIFNKLEKESQSNTRSGKSANKHNDGSYHYSGKDIKSSRQKFVDVQPKQKQVNYDEEDIIINSRNKKKKTPDGETEKEGFFLSSVMKAVLYIVGVISVSIILAYNIITIANDVFAFVKEPFSVEVDIPEDAKLSDITDILHSKGLIRYPNIFEFYIKYRGKDNNFVAGTYTITSTMNYDEFVGKFRKKTDKLQTVRVTIPEGYSIDEIIDVFVKNGIGSRSGFEEIINTNDFSHNGYKFLKLLNETELSPDRKYKLEGYLFPDTYEFYKSTSELDVITRFLNNFQNKFKEEFYARCDALGMTVDDIINLASIIEREAKNPEDFPMVSSVFHNRLLHKASFPRMESNATQDYLTGKRNSEALFMDKEEREKDTPYNTYTREGLPPSAICNPGYEAIFAALYPDVTDYFYFVSNSEGSMLYAQTYNEHLANTAEARAE